MSRAEQLEDAELTMDDAIAEAAAPLNTEDLGDKFEQFTSDAEVSSGAVDARKKLQRWEQDQFGDEETESVVFSSVDELPPEAQEKYNALHGTETYSNNETHG